MQKKITSFDNTKINYDIHRGAKDIFLIFIHGAGGNLTAWQKEREFFHRKGLSTLALDLRGHGLSDRPQNKENYSLENFAQDIYLVINNEKIKIFTLVGHCFGGVVTTMFHKLYPDKSHSYVLIDTTYKAPKSLTKVFQKHPYLFFILNKIMENENLRKKHFSHLNYKRYLGTNDWNLRRIYADIRHTSFKSWLFTFEAIANFDGTQILRTIKQPVLVIEGEKDSIFNILAAKKIVKLIKRARLDVVPEANHIIVLNNPGELEREILNFIKLSQ